MADTSAAKKTAWILGFLGLLPFIAHPIAMLMYSAPPLPAILLESQKVYAAVILSFLGALHWGRVLGDQGNRSAKLRLLLVWSVLPSLVAWLALRLTSQTALVVLSCALAVVFIVDWRVYRRHPALQWFVPLRLTLTTIAIASLLATAALIRTPASA